MQHPDTSDLKASSPTVSIPRSETLNPITQLPITDEANSPLATDKSILSPKTRRLGRFMVLMLIVAFLVIGRYSVPDNEVTCLEDRVFQALQPANDFINQEENKALRHGFQVFDSLLIDIVFIITFGYWVARGTTSRLPICLAIFYLTRAIVQQIHLSPFPTGWYFMNPGFPSLVVPYGRGSDFFFSGHAGFLVVCSKEWHRLGKPRVRNFAIFVTMLTIVLLLLYRVHYFIDIFTGVFFADYCFDKVEGVKEKLDRFFACRVRNVFDFLDKSLRAKVNAFEQRRLVVVNNNA